MTEGVCTRKPMFPTRKNTSPPDLGMLRGRQKNGGTPQHVEIENRPLAALRAFL